MIAELKCELERQIEEKGSMAAENKRLRGHIERKEQQEKQRKLLLMSEFREIDKMEKIVKKII
jgi:regulator of replication initiation timing